MNDQNQDSQSLLFGLVTISIIFFILAVFVVYLVYQVYQNNYRVRLMKLENEIVQKQFDHQLLEAQMEVQESTLKRLSSEIHDNVGQLLSVARLTLSSIDPANAKQEQQLVQTSSIIQQSLIALRALAHSMYAGNLLDQGLKAALTAELDRLEKTAAFEIHFSVRGEVPEQPMMHELLAFRIFQELMVNVIKHADATQIMTELTYTADSWTLELSDNGKGFDLAAQLANRSGLGLQNMIRRAESMGGSLQFFQHPTRAVLWVPMVANPSHRKQQAAADPG